jgi:ribosome biogenesis GTPase
MRERRVHRESDVRGASVSSPGVSHPDDTSTSTDHRSDAPRLLRGRVIEAVGGVYTVELDDGRELSTRLRGRLKLEQRTGDRVVVGDLVDVAEREGEDATIEKVAPRRTELVRRAPGRNARRAKVIAANVEQVVIVFAAANPEPRLRMLDRFLVLAELNGLAAHIVINKLDVAGDADALRARFSPYAAAGYDVLFTSTKQNLQLDAFRALLCGRESAIAGPSGVGKSSLLNSLEPGLSLRVGAVSEAVNKGTHTTVSARLVRLGCGGHVVDTPGLREVGLWGMDPDRLDDAFPEFRPYLDQCRFGSSCTHTHEPDCAVQAAVEEGAVVRERYESYRTLLTDS